MEQPYKEIVEVMNEAYEEFGLLISKETSKLDELNLSVQQELILSYINKNKQTTANEISANFNISKSAVSQVLSKLEKQEIICKTANPLNKREFFLKLGKKGKWYIERLQELDEILIKKYYSKIDIKELQQMTNTMKKINKIIRDSNN